MVITLEKDQARAKFFEKMNIFKKTRDISDSPWLEDDVVSCGKHLNIEELYESVNFSLGVITAELKSILAHGRKNKE